MRIQKEIENVERIENRQPVEPLTMEDAVIQHKKAVDKYEEERKEINKELDLDDDIEEKGFTGASKEPKKVSTPELKKMKLSESLFKSLNEELKYDDVQYMNDSERHDLFKEYHNGVDFEDEDDFWDWAEEEFPFEEMDESLNEEFKISDKTIKLLMFELYDVYSGMDEVETFYRFCLNKLNMTVTDIVKYVGAFVKSDIDYIADFIINDTGYYNKEDNNYSDTNKVVKILRKYGIDAVAVRDYDDYDEEEFFDIEVKGLLNKNTNESLDEAVEGIDMGELLELVDGYNTSTPVSGDWDTETQHEQKIIADHFNLSMEEAKQVMIDMLGFEEDMFPVEEESLEEAKINRQNQRRKRDANLDRQEAEARKRAEREKKLQGEEDWYKVARDIEDQEGDFGGYLDSKGYTSDEKEFITKYLDDIYNDENEKAAHEREYQRNKKIEAEKQAEEERKKAEQEKEEKTKKNLERIGKAANAPKDVANAFKKGLGNAGIHIG